MKPEAGQWWFPVMRNKHSRTRDCGVFIVGTSSSGRIVVEFDGAFEEWDNLLDYEHEPRCTGWDWVVPKEDPQPAEDPDEWVIQDVTIVRPGIDQVIWDEKLHDADCGFFCHTHSGSKSDGKMHGYRTGGIFLSVRCRRRDLPKVEQKKTTDDFGMYLESVIAKDPQLKAEVDAAEAELAAIDARLNKPEPQPQKTRVRLWKNAYGSVMSNPDCENIEGWQEIHHDAEGFYTID